MKKLLLPLLACLLLAAALSAAVPTEQFTWKNLSVGGRGTANGIIAAGPNNWYLRTDVGYCYKWDPLAQGWTPLLGDISLIFFQKPGQPFYNPDIKMGGDCMGADTLNPNILYLVIGANDDPTGSIKGNIFKSTDGGVNFVHNPLRIRANANAQQDYANRILLDRVAYNSGNQDYRVVYIASREGLYRSFDYGATFTQNPAWPTGDLTGLTKSKERAGLCWFVADSSGGTVGTAGSSTDPLRTRVLYLGAHNSGTYRSIDGGETWTKISTIFGWHGKLVPAGSPTKVGGSPGPVTTQSVLYVTDDSGIIKVVAPEIGSPAFDVVKTPIPSGGSWTRGFTAIDIDPTNANHVVAASNIGGAYGPWPSNPNRMFRTLNAGVTWAEVDMSQGTDHPFGGSYVSLAGGCQDIMFDPADPNRLFFLTRDGPWRTDDINAAQPLWRAMYKGYELGVVTSAIAPAGNGPVVLHHGSGDYDGLSSIDPDNFYNTIYRRNFVTNPGIVDSGAKHSPVSWDYRKDIPDVVWFSGLRDYNVSSPINPKKDFRVGYTANGGTSWTFVDPLKLPGVPSQIMASVGSSRVVLGTADGVGTAGFYYSDDLGNTWTRSNGVTGSFKGTYIFNNYQKTVASDHVAAGVFYAVKDSVLYRSTDDAANFSVCTNAGLAAFAGDKNAAGWLDAAPGKAGYVVWSAQAAGLFVSTNASTSGAANVNFSKLADVSLAYRATWGAPAPGATEPTLYVFGTVLGENGVFLSKDLGANWVKISDPTRLFGNNPRIITADPDVYGRVYFGTVGSGIWYGDASGGSSAPPTPPSSLAAVVGNAQVALTWGSVGNATSYTVKYGTSPGSYPTTIGSITTTNRAVTGLTNGTTYYFVVTATNANGTSANSGAVSARPGTPSVALTSPGVSSGYTAPATITVSATASDLDGTVSKVEFFANGTLIATDTVAPYTYDYTGVAAGTYTFTAVVTDNSGLTATSAAVTVNVSSSLAQTATAPLIDGTVDSVWNNATALTVGNVSGTVSSSADLSATWKALWDATYLYVLVQVTDDVRTVDSTPALYNDDAVELFIDADNSKGTTYGANDFQFLFSADGTTFQEAKHNAVTGVTFARVNGTGGNYTMEIRIPWTTLSVTPTVNNLIGLDLQVDDDDDGGNRDGLKQWNDTSNQVWSNPSLMGSMRFGSTGTPTPPPAAPTNVSTVAGNARVDLAWSASSGATSYRVKRGTAAGGPFTQVGSETAALTFADTNVINETIYYYVVAAVNSAGTSADSSPAVAAMPTAYPTTPVASVAPIIDGAVDQAWLAAPALGVANVGGTVSSSADLSGTWRMLWDASYLYVLFEVTDDTKKNDSPEPWFDDSVELYLDIGNTKTATYGTNHFHYAFGWNDTVVTEANGKSTAGIVYSWTNSPTGYVVEVRVPWSTVGGSPASGQLLGIDVQINDDDDASAARDGLLQWNDTTNTAYANPSKFGTTRLSGAPSAVPAAPNGLTASPGNAQVTLSWNASSGASSYKVKRATSSGGTYATIASSLTSTGYTDTTSANGTTYYYVVSAVNSGGESANSAPPVSARPDAPPAAPTGLAATLGSAQVNLAWNTVSTAVSYAVYRGTTSGGPFDLLEDGLANPGYIDTSVTAATTYFYVVSAANVGGTSANSAQVSITTLAPPAAPTGVAATAGSGQVQLSWTAVSGATSYTVRWGTVSGSYANSSVAAGSPATITSLTNGTTYYFVVSAVNSAGEGANSTQVSAVPFIAPPAAPTGVTANLGNTLVQVGWNNVSGASSYVVRWGTVSGTYPNSVTSSVGPVNITGLTNGTTYYFVVAAVNAGGTGANSTQVSAVPVAPPAAPTNLVATPGNAQVALSWTASSGATGYKVKRSPAAGGAYTVLGSPVGTTYTDTNSVNGTSYAYFVSALKNLSESPDAGPAFATPLVNPLPVADAYVNAGSSSSANFGTNALLFVKNSGTGDTTREAFLRFDVTGLQNAPSVKVRLTPTTIQGAPTLNLEHVTTDTWVESGSGSINWTNKPAGSGTVLAASNAFTVNTPAEFDLTAQARTEAAGNGLLSLRLHLPAVQSTDQYQFASKENATAAYRPQLLVAFTDWTQGDVGAVGLAGSATINDSTGVFTITGAGAGIAGTADAGYFIDQPLNGNGEIVARIVSVQNPNSNARAGLTIRETATAGAIHASALISAGGTIEFRRRTATGGTTTITSVTGYSPAYWLKLVRTGDSFSVYRSPDGTTWTQIGTTQTVAMSASARVGLIVTSGTTSALGTSVFESVTVKPTP